jgi:hypothetical protein
VGRQFLLEGLLRSLNLAVNITFPAFLLAPWISETYGIVGIVGFSMINVAIIILFDQRIVHLVRGMGPHHDPR